MILEFNDYLNDVKRTECHDLYFDGDRNLEIALFHGVLGFISEVGEVQSELAIDTIKSVELRLELGDVFFYLGILINQARFGKTSVEFDLPKQEISSVVDLELVQGIINQLYFQASEMCDILKKSLFQGIPLDYENFFRRTKIALNYMCYLCGFLGIQPESIMAENIAKRVIRYPNGFSIKGTVKKN